MIMFLIVGDVKSEPRNNTAGLRVNIHKQVQLIGQQIRMRIFLQRRVRWVDLLALRCRIISGHISRNYLPFPSPRPSAWSASPSPAPPRRTWDGEREGGRGGGQ